jgi:hypothetical protein
MKKMKIKLSVDGRKIPMNEFVQKIVGNVIKAMVETLHTINPEWKEISIHIEREKSDENNEET